MKRSPFKVHHRPPRESTQSSYSPRPRAPAVAIADGKARMVVPVPKSAPVVHEGYRRLVSLLPCINCGAIGRSQAAHGPTLGKGIKADDRTCVPLCADITARWGCHTLVDRYMLFTRAERAQRMAEWGRQTRAQIVAAGHWPAAVPLPDIEINPFNCEIA